MQAAERSLTRSDPGGDSRRARTHAGRTLLSALVLAGAAACHVGSDAGDTARVVRRLAPQAEEAALRVANGEARRGWSRPIGDVTSLSLRARAGARLEVSVALSADPSADGVTTARAELEIVRPGDSLHRQWTIERGDGWQTAVIDLSDHAELDLELRLSSSAVSGTPAPGDLIHWAEVIVVEPAARSVLPNVVLVTLDTTRADVAADPAIAPNLASLARRGTAFDRAWSPATSTTPAHASLHTGLPVDRHGARSNRSRLADEHRTLAEALAAAGYQTAAAVSVRHLEPRAGLGQGFDRFLLAQPGAGADGAITLARAEAWLDDWHEQGPRPFFLWLHVFDPHSPYGGTRAFRDGPFAERGFTMPPRRTQPPSVPVFPRPRPTPLAWLKDIDNRAHVDALYRAGVAYADHLLGRLLERLEHQGLTNETIVVATADHGEALGERGVWYQHTGLWPESLRVPLVIAVPGGGSIRHVDRPVTTQDVFPTILSLLGLASPEEAARDLLHASDESSEPRALWFADTRLSLLGFRDTEVHFAHALRSGQFGVLTREHMGVPIVRAVQRYEPGQSWLFDVNADPSLEQNLSRDPGAGLGRYRALVQQRARLAVPDVAVAELSDEEQRALEALGYGVPDDPAD